MKRVSALALVATFALSACGAASQSGASSGAVPQAPAAATKHKKQRLVPIRITITMPHKKGHKRLRKGHYISPDATQMVIVLNTVNGGPTPNGLLTTVTTQLTTGPGGNCTVAGGTQTCTVSGPSVPVGTDNITFISEDASENQLSDVNKDFDVVAGAANSFSATLLGTPGSFTLSTAGLTAGTAVASQAVNLGVMDADGDTIAGSADFSNPVTIKSLESDGVGSVAVLLSVNGGSPATSVQVVNPADVVTLVYTGLSIAPFNIRASATSATTKNAPVNVTLTGPVAVCSDGGATVCASGPQVNLYDVSPNTGSTANLKVTQTGWTASPWLQNIAESDNCGAAGVNIATVAQTGSTSPGGAGTVFSVTTLGSPAAGASCTANFTGGDAADFTTPVTITYTVSGISVNGRHIHRSHSPQQGTRPAFSS